MADDPHPINPETGLEDENLDLNPDDEFHGKQYEPRRLDDDDVMMIIIKSLEFLNA